VDIGTAVLQKIESALNARIVGTRPISGGDINESLLLQMADGTSLFAKYNASAQHELIIRSDHEGLLLIKEAGVATPRIINFSSTQQFSFLVLEFLESGIVNANSNISIATQLAALHSHTADFFGLTKDNMIGSIEQRNNKTSNFIDFYIDQRIGVQYQLAVDNGRLAGIDIDSFYKTLEDLIPEEQPSLIHGDLWSGNLIVNHKSEAVFIDPSVAHSHREFDLAMMSLFGGFDSEVFGIYNELFPLEQGWEDRAELFQLYYILVHLNIFGQSYEGQVRRIISKYL